MNKQLKGRIQNAWAMLDPVDPLRGLLSDLLDALAQPEQQPLGWIASMAHNDLRDGIFRDVTIYGAELYETIPIYTAQPLPVQQPVAPTPKEQGYVPLSDDGKSVFIDGFGEVPLAYPPMQPAPMPAAPGELLGNPEQLPPAHKAAHGITGGAL